MRQKASECKNNVEVVKLIIFRSYNFENKFYTPKLYDKIQRDNIRKCLNPSDFIYFFCFSIFLQKIIKMSIRPLALEPKLKQLIFYRINFF